MNNQGHPRPLAPGPPRTFAPQSPMAVSRPKKNSTACLTCKTAKRKCSGPPAPCKACTTAGIDDCQFDPTRDLRRKVAVKRVIEELSNYKELLEAFFRALRTETAERVQSIIELVRSNASLNEIAEAVGSPAVYFSDPKALSNASHLISDDGDPNLAYFEADENKPRRASDISEEELPRKTQITTHPYARVTLESLCDIPMISVPSKPWTEVTDDNELVSHLISLYFTWDHPCAQFVDRETFLEHMEKGDLNSEFCSPLLVNGLLAVASTYSDSPIVFSNSENAFSRGEKFLAEAERLWRAQEGRSSLTNIQGLLLMGYLLSCQGKSRLGWLTLRQAVELAQDLGMFKHPSVIQRGQKSPEMKRAYTITAWGIFSLNLQMSIKLQRFANLEYPVSNIYAGGDHDFDWVPYPRSNQIAYDKKPAHLPKIRRGLVDLTIIMVEIKGLLDDAELHTNFRALQNRAKAPYDRLQNWLTDWPDLPKDEKDPIPQLLTLRLKCLQVSMSLLEALIDRAGEDPMAVSIRDEWCEQAIEMTRCLSAYRLSYGLKHIPSQVADIIQTALHGLLKRLEDTKEATVAFIECCRFGVVLSQKFKPVAEIIQALQHENARLPHDAIAILEDSDL
ncbi:Transcription factor [Penicillium taxi]|uniref:Transcription factor n=1 Tax=Penicillium taxi TaxID=168475 RepID=UPI002545AB25|nr:Transcription factor [Penicillium taxi]KAJ5907529.1 Transcription factor [Penicillium taxi]